MKRRIAIIAGLASAGMVFGASTAYADGKVVRTTDYAQSGEANWSEDASNYGRLMVCDFLRDDYQVVGWIYRPNPGNPSTGPTEINLLDPAADGRCVSERKYIAQSVNIHIKVCLVRNGVVRNCSYNRIPQPRP